jgi:ABC-type lipoprotein release transport system permease subunit
VSFLRLIGAVGSMGGFLLCFLILLNNPYTHSSVEPEVFTSFTLMYLLPVMLAIYASISIKPKLLLVCSIWALPLSLYCLATTGVF